MTTAEAPQRDDAPAPERRVLVFKGVPVFRVLKWHADGYTYMQAEELDLVAAVPEGENPAPKLGCMIFDLFHFLAEEVADPTESELETLDLITKRVGRALLRYHWRKGRAALLERVKALFSSDIEWRVGPPSTPHGSTPALTG